MSTWQIFTDTENNPRWDPSPSPSPTPPSHHPPPPRHHALPSFHAVLLQGCSLILDGTGNNNKGNVADVDSTPVFRTGLGKSVVMNKAAIAKAASVLGPVFRDNFDSGQPCFEGHDFTSPNFVFQTGFGKDVRGHGFVSPDSMFQTGSGKSVALSKASIAKAASVLGDGFRDNFDTGQPCFQGDDFRSHNDHNKKGNVDDADNMPMFRTGSGKSVVLNMASIAKAASVLGDDFQNNVNTDQPCFQGHDFTSPNSVFQTGLRKNVRGHGFSSPNSMFQTGSGKGVNISSSGLLRAKALLGMDENNDDFQNFEPAKKKFRGSDLSRHEKKKNLENRQVFIDRVEKENDTLFTNFPFISKNDSSANEVVEDIRKPIQPGMCNSTTKPSSIKFSTAGGRSISVSSDALKRAKNLLGDPEVGSLLDEEDSGASMFSVFTQGNSDESFFNKENTMNSSMSHHQFERSKQNPKIFVSPMKQSSNRNQLETKPETLVSRTNLIGKFNDESTCKSIYKPSCPKNSLPEKPLVGGAAVPLSKANSVSSGLYTFAQPSTGPLVDITNTVRVDSTSKKGATTELRRLGRRSSVSPFKLPRSSKFVTPLNSSLSSIPNGFPSRESEASFPRRKVSTRYPFQLLRSNIQDFFKGPPTYPQTVEHIQEQVRQINPGNSVKYMFYDGSQLIGVEAFHHMLVQSGAFVQHATKEWVANHFKWIVWKLASYERFYSAEFDKKFLTVSNVLEELKYRYECEVNNGHRSALKRILEGDASPSSMVVLCVSAIQSEAELETSSTDMAGKSSIARIELTDGWYSIGARLDLLLSKQLAVRKIFVGQKLRICGANLNGWDGPVSPLEVSAAISLLLHINGTYRASWDERLGFCRGACAPLAFRCIKGNGGLVPRTLVGVTRIYPVLYRERSKSGGYIVRSEKMEDALIEHHNQRRCNIIEGIASDFQRGLRGSFIENDYASDEGAKILKMLENAAEPELLMAEMSSEQLASFSKYRAKVEETRQSDLQKLIEKALEDAGLGAREVTPFMRVRVVGLKNKDDAGIKDLREGLITIWSPTERQKLELVEGQAYTVSGLTPLHSDSNTLYLQARGSSTRLKPLSTIEKKSFVPFFNPRKPMSLSRMGEVPLSSEFDSAVMVLHVGREHIAGQQKRQWMFVTDGSLCDLQTEESTLSLLAISFSSPCTDDSSISVINHNLVGSIVAICNLVKRAKDHVNSMWVAEATENSIYYLNYDHPYCSHLKDAIGSVKKWQQNSSSTIENLREKVQYIVGGHNG